MYSVQNDTDFTAHATVIVHEASFYSDIIFGGTVGSGEAYMARSWDCHELTDLVRIILRNEHVLNSIDGGFGKLMLPLHKAFHFLHRNSLSGSRKNIGAHYDLGNDMFEQFLDPTMMYSSGIFEHQDMTMEQASIAKLDRICQKLQLDENDHVLEIGTGWGGFAIYAARNYGCKVTTTTISQQQFDYAEQRISDEGLGRQDHPALRRLSQPDWAIRQTGFDRDDRSRWSRLLQELFPALQQAAETRRHDVTAIDNHRRPALPGGQQRSRLHSALYISRWLVTFR